MTARISFYQATYLRDRDELENPDWYIAHECKYIGEVSELNKYIKDILSQYEGENYVFTQFRSSYANKSVDKLYAVSKDDDFTKEASTIYIYNGLPEDMRIIDDNVIDKEKGQVWYVGEEDEKDHFHITYDEEHEIETGDYGVLEAIIKIEKNWIKKKLPVSVKHINKSKKST